MILRLMIAPDKISVWNSTKEGVFCGFHTFAYSPELHNRLIGHIRESIVTTFDRVTIINNKAGVYVHQ